MPVNKIKCRLFASVINLEVIQFQLGLLLNNGTVDVMDYTALVVRFCILYEVFKQYSVHLMICMPAYTNAYIHMQCIIIVLYSFLFLFFFLSRQGFSV